MKNGKFLRIFAISLILAMTLAFASCVVPTSGSLKLESFTVDKSSVKTDYLIGEAIDFSGIKALVRYSDESLDKIYTYDELTITYDEDITATVGTKEVTVSFDDPNLNVKQETKVQIKVSETDEPDDTTEPQLLVGFEAPASLVAFKKFNASAGTINYGEPGFFGQFAKGGKTYVIGNENEFKFVPLTTILDSDIVDLDKFYANIKISMGGVALTAVAGEGNIVSYYNGETLIVTVDTYKNTYKFSDGAVGQRVTISVLPSEEYYIYEDVNAVVLEADIVKAYNVYEAWELAVIDNYNSAYNEFKLEKGILGVNVSGIVLHSNLKLTAADVPDSFFYTTTEDVTYTNSVTKETVTIPAGSKYLADYSYIYHRVGTGDFIIEGNLCTIDASEFPIVPSPGVFGKDSGKDYDSDFSNAALFNFATVGDYYSEAKPDEVADVVFNNVQIRGNAARDNLIDSTESLASAGGLIFIKSSNYTKMHMSNAIGNSFFISYFVDYGSELHISDIKCSDSYQNAAFIWGNCIFTVADSYLDGCGGPVILAQSVVKENVHPIVTVTNSVVNTKVTGSEIWFNAVGANAIMPSIDLLSTNLKNAGFGSLKNDGKMNIMGALMANGSGLSDVIDIGAQGSMIINGSGIDRFDTNMDWQVMKGITSAITNGNFSDPTKIPPFLTVNVNGKSYTIWTDGTNFYDLTVPNPYPTPVTPATHGELLQAFMTADTITLTQGGLSVVFQFYH